jgi:hypothetical protein
MKVKEILAAFYIFGYLAQLRTESGDFFLVSKFGEKKLQKQQKKFANLKKNSPKKTPFFPRVQIWESFRVWRSWQTQCPC